MLENNFENKADITFNEYMHIQVERIEKAMQDPEFIEYVQAEYGLNKNVLPERNQFAAIWTRDNSEKFRIEMESKYHILGRE